MSIPLDPVSLTEFVSLVYHHTPGQNTSMQRIAYEKQAYTLTDRGKWLATKDKDKLEMIIVLEGDPSLFNPYGVMAVNPEKHKHVKFRGAMEFVNWIISKGGQDAVASFKDKNGNVLFIPNTK